MAEESFDAEPASISLIGGGARENAWCQILADMLGHPIDVYVNADILPAVALASLVFDRLSLALSIAETTPYVATPAAAHIYDEHYPRFLKLYPAVASLS